MIANHNQWLREDGLRICHINIYHHFGKLPDLPVILNHQLYVFGITESHLADKIANAKIFHKGFLVIRKGAARKLETGLRDVSVAYFQQAGVHNVFRASPLPIFNKQTFIESSGRLLCLSSTRRRSCGLRRVSLAIFNKQALIWSLGRLLCPSSTSRRSYHLQGVSLVQQTDVRRVFRTFPLIIASASTIGAHKGNKSALSLSMVIYPCKCCKSEASFFFFFLLPGHSCHIGPFHSNGEFHLRCKYYRLSTVSVAPAMTLLK